MTERRQSQVVIGVGHTRVSLGANWAVPTRRTNPPYTGACRLIPVLDLFTFLEIFVLEILLPTHHFLLQLLYLSPHVVFIIPHPTLLETSVFHVQTHRKPRDRTGLVHWECLSNSRSREEVEIGSYVIYRFVVILQHETERPNSKQMVKQTHFYFVYLFCLHSY